MGDPDQNENPTGIRRGLCSNRDFRKIVLTIFPDRLPRTSRRAPRPTPPSSVDAQQRADGSWPSARGDVRPDRAGRAPCYANQLGEPPGSSGDAERLGAPHRSEEETWEEFMARDLADEEIQQARAMLQPLLDNPAKVPNQYPKTNLERLVLETWWSLRY